MCEVVKYCTVTKQGLTSDFVSSEGELSTHGNRQKGALNILTGMTQLHQEATSITMRSHLCYEKKNAASV